MINAAFVCRNDHIFLTSDQECSVPLSSFFLEKFLQMGIRLISVTVSSSACINADGMGGLAGHGKKLRHIALEKFRHMDVHKSVCANS